MKKLNYLFVWALLFHAITLQSQNSNLQQAQNYLDLKGEVIFEFTIDDLSELSWITKELAIVHYDENKQVVKVMANADQFDLFLQKKISFSATKEDNIIGERLMTDDLNIKAATFPLTAYPTYFDYESMMNEFASKYPTICKLENIGSTTEGDKSLLFVKLSDQVNENEQEPRVMYTSSMHGDEIAGYPMMLNLIDFLLTTYEDTSHPRHQEIKQLLDNNEVWINPLANPDGTYRNSSSNTSVANATRGNANNVDLNRNYPDPDSGANPDGNPYQVETLAFMAFAEAQHFVLSANFHGGIELVNYPWDTFGGAHPDEDYFIYISSEYRDHCQADGPSGYFDGRNNGITNGYDWYEVEGGRQDYQIYTHKGREITVELSNAKTPSSGQLVNFWNYNKNALIDFLKQVNYGFRGVVTDAVSNEAVQARITVVGKESYESWVPTELPEGDYYRPIKGGTYDLLFEADCYESVLVTGLTIADYETVIQNVQMNPLGVVAPDGVLVSNVQSTSADLNWNGGSGIGYDVRYRAVGTIDWIIQSSEDNFVIVPGLTPETQYEAQVRSNCDGNTSEYSEAVTFTTTAIPACNGISSFPYQESFESGFGSWTNLSDDNIDWRRNSGSTPSNSTGPSSANDGNFYLYTEASSNAAGNPNKVAIIESSCIDLSLLSGALLEFDYHMYGAAMGSFEVLVSIDQGVTFSSIWDRSGNIGTSWNEAAVDLTPYVGGVIKLQFKGTTGTSWRSDMAFDNIRIKSTIIDTDPPSAPTNLVANTVTDNSVSLSWNIATDNTVVEGYDIYQDGVVVTSASDTSAVVSGLDPSSSYSFYVVALDGSGNTSLPSNVVEITTQEQEIAYCDSFGTNVNYEYIDFVGIGGISNTTSANGGYGDFTSLVGDLAYGENTIQLSLGFANSSYTEYWGVWIDFNRNGDFEASEKIINERTTSDQLQSYPFLVPSTALSGTTRMRVILRYNREPNACDIYTYGEVEDYTVNIQSAKQNTTSFLNMDTTIALELYPNPVTDGLLFIDTKNKIESYRIYNQLGQEIKGGVLSSKKIDINNLSGGIYFIKLKIDDKSLIKRFVVK